MKSIEQQLRIIISEELRKCSPSAYPNFCRMIETREGYRKAEDMIINYALKNQMNIGSAIAQLEMEL
jgi:hypothetical protein